jgi:hypothetical protein
MVDLLTMMTEVNKSSNKCMLVAGHTFKGIHKDAHLTDLFVNVSRVKELRNTNVKEHLTL